MEKILNHILINGKIPFLWFFLLVIGSCLSSCGPEVIYEEKQTVKDGIWTYGDSLTYTFEIKDTQSLYEIVLNVAHTNDLPFENTYVKISSTYPDGAQKNDVLSLEFADENGLWMGKAKGDVFVAPIALQPTAHFNQVGKYKMVFHQYTRSETLTGIESLVLQIIKKDQ